MDELTRLAIAGRDGDRTALAMFARRAQADVWRFCAHAGDRSQADDLTQETFLRAIGALRSFRGESSARTWLLSIASRTCADAVRRAQRQRGLLERFRAVAPSDVAADGSGSLELDQLVSGLDPDRRNAFVLTQVIGLPYDEAAEVCHCPVGTIRSRVSRARADLLPGTSWTPRATTGGGPASCAVPNPAKETP
jgi:RNA polymerase sigma-70 factor (ECF subfamily)